MNKQAGRGTVQAFSVPDGAQVQSWALPGLQGTHIIPLSRPKSEQNVFARLAQVLEQERKPSAEEVAAQKAQEKAEAEEKARQEALAAEVEAAKAAGFAEGKAQGIEQGVEEGRQQGIEQGQAEVKAAAETLLQLTESFAQPLQNQEEKLAKTLAKLAHRLARTTLEAELQNDSKHIERLLLDALAHLPKQLPVTVRLHPDNLARIDGQFSHPDFDIQLKSDPNIDLASCEISNGATEILQSYHQRFDDYAQQLFGELLNESDDERV